MTEYGMKMEVACTADGEVDPIIKDHAMMMLQRSFNDNARLYNFPEGASPVITMPEKDIREHQILLKDGVRVDPEDWPEDLMWLPIEYEWQGAGTYSRAIYWYYIDQHEYPHSFTENT